MAGSNALRAACAILATSVLTLDSVSSSSSSSSSTPTSSSTFFSRTPEGAPLLNTSWGPVTGTVLSNGVVYFGAVPFAAPPVGPLRFRAPHPPTPWTTPIDVNFAPMPCPQIKLDGSIFIGAEDCLYLSVWVPEAAAAAASASGGPGLPIMQWIFGGAFILGDASELGMYDGANVAAARNVIIVNGNYRVGLFGFMALPALIAEDPNGSTGNAAIQDQRAAMQWTQANAVALGGDPTHVALFGESAGGFSVCCHYTSAASKGLFSSAMMESGSCDTPQFFQNLSLGLAFNELYGAAVGCNQTDPVQQLACMRGLTAEKIQESLLDWFNPNWPFIGGVEEKAANSAASLTLLRSYRDTFIASTGLPSSKVPTMLPSLAPIMPWGPAIDGTDVGLRELPLNILAAGNFDTSIPWIVGTNHDEGSIFVPLLPIIVNGTHFPPASGAELVGFVKKMLESYNQSIVNTIANAAVQLYNISNYADNNWAHMASDMLTHYFFACSARRTVRAASSHGTNVYMYQFSYNMSSSNPLYDLLGNFHSSELAFVWDNPPFYVPYAGNDKNISDFFTGRWSNMAASGDPNVGPAGAGPVSWPLYTQATDTNMQIQLPFSTTSGLLSDKCDFWDQAFAQTTGAGSPWEKQWRKEGGQL